MDRIVLKQGKDGAVRRFHPWIFSGAVQERVGACAEGALVEVYGADGEFRGTGFFCGSSIEVKLLTPKKIRDEIPFFREQMQRAISARGALGLDAQNTNAYRVVNAEGDGIPGLIVDRYDRSLVMQCHTVGAYIRRELFAQILKDEFGAGIDTIYSKSSDTLRGVGEQYQSVADEFLFGDRANGIATEHGIQYRVDWVSGQKTGFFIDQRDSRLLLSQIARDEDVLNCFCYTGGFSLAAARGAARAVTSVDVSEPALELLRGNMALNEFEVAGEVRAADCFEFLKRDTGSYGIVVIDPPPFAKSRAALDGALSGYRALNHLAVLRVRRGGWLMTFSCSGVVSRADLYEAVLEGAVQAGRRLIAVKELSAPACHPHLLSHREGEYLKGVLCRVE